MSKAARRTSKAGGRSRRTPSRAKGRAGLNIPWLPVSIAAGAVIIVGLIVFLVLQAGSDGSDAEAIAAEADASTALPGEYIDLPAIYGGPYSETAGHVSEQVDYSAQGLPPVGGPHWSGGCTEDPSSSPAFCGPAGWGIYREPWEPETLVHNMEHGGVVVWYKTTDQAVIDDLEALVTDRLENDELLVMAPFPEMAADTIAVTAWSRRDMFPVSEYTKERVETFIDAHARRFNPEDI